MLKKSDNKLFLVSHYFESLKGGTILHAWKEAESYHSLDLTSKSPLWLVTTEPILNELVTDLQHLRLELMEEGPKRLHQVEFSRHYLEEVRIAFANMIRLGERHLHRLCQLLCESFVSSYKLESVVIGEVEGTGERFRLAQDISIADLFSTTDIDLGTRQLDKLLFRTGNEWSKACLVANVVDYQPTESNEYGIHRITSRIKAEEEIWNKVVDELFDLDRLVVKDKKLRHLSRYVKDIFGLKIVVGELADVHRMQNSLLDLEWSNEFLNRFDVEPREYNRRLEFMEVKDYTTLRNRKQSGWEAVKSVVQWGGKTFEIQILPLRTFMREREILTKESHLSFRANREQVREQVAQKIPLFRFYQELLRWLFLEPDREPPTHPGVTLRLVD